MKSTWAKTLAIVASVGAVFAFSRRCGSGAGETVSDTTPVGESASS